MKKIYLFLFILVFTFPMLGQQNINGKTINRGRIYTTDSLLIEGQYIVISSDSVEFYQKDSQERYIFGLAKVNKIEQYDGNWGNTGAWIGGIVGLGAGIGVALGTKETERTGYLEVTTIQTWPIYLFTLVGTLGGYLIGASSEDWKTVYSKTTAFLKDFKIENNRNYGGLCLSYNVHF